MEYYYQWLQPWEHYIPMERDFTDLDDKVAFAESQLRAMRALSQRATAFTERYLSFPCIAALIAALLWRYRAFYRA